jgi:hypothetical protein
MKNLLAAGLVFLGLASEPTQGRILGREPGVSMQLTEGFFREWKKVMMDDYVNYVNLNKEKVLPTEIKGHEWKIKNIKYEDMQVTFDRFSINFD